MTRRLSNTGDGCYWNKTWKTNCAVRLEVHQHYTERILMKHNCSEQNGHDSHSFSEVNSYLFFKKTPNPTKASSSTWVCSPEETTTYSHISHCTSDLSLTYSYRYWASVVCQTLYHQTSANTQELPPSVQSQTTWSDMKMTK